MQYYIIYTLICWLPSSLVVEADIRLYAVSLWRDVRLRHVGARLRRTNRVMSLRRGIVLLEVARVEKDFVGGEGGLLSVRSKLSALLGDLFVERVEESVVLVFEPVPLVLETLVVQLELLAVDQLQELVPGDEQVKHRKTQEDKRERVSAVPDLHVENELSQKAPEEGEVQKEEALHGEVARNVALETGPSEQVVLVDPVVDAEADEDEEGADGDKVGIEEGKPHHFDEFGIALTHVVVVVGHQVVGLVLSHIVLALMVVPVPKVALLQGVDRPDERHEEGAENEHNGLFLDDAEVVLVVVVELEGLDHDGHEGSGEEHAQGVLKRKGEVLVGLVVVLFQVREDVQHVAHHELVEENNAQKSRPRDYSGNRLVSRRRGRAWVLLFLLNRRHQEVGLGELKQVENSSDDGKEEETESPANGHVFDAIAGLLQVFVDDFPWLWGFFKDNRLLGIAEIFADEAFFLVVFNLFEEALLLGLSLEDDDGVTGGNGVVVDALDSLLHDLELLLMDLSEFLEVFHNGVVVVDGLGMEILLVKFVLFVIQVVHLLCVGNKDDLIDFVGLPLLVFDVPREEAGELFSNAAHSLRNILDHHCVIREVALHFVVVFPGLTDFILDVEQSEHVDDERPNSEHDLVVLKVFVCASDHQEEVVALARQVKIGVFLVLSLAVLEVGVFGEQVMMFGNRGMFGHVMACLVGAAVVAAILH